MEKTIILTPAVAALTVAGARKVVEVNPRPGEIKECQLIISSGRVFNYEMPVEFIMECHNQIVFGNIPPTTEMPREEIVGVVKLGWETDGDRYPMWSKMKMAEQKLYYITDCAIFDYPIKRSLIDLEKLDGEIMLRHFSSHSIHHLNTVMQFGEYFKVEMGKQYFELVTIFNRLTLDLTEEVKEEVLDENGNIKNDIKYLILSYGNREKKFVFKAEIRCELNAEGEPMLFHSAFDPSGKSIREQIVFDCETQLLW